MAVAVFVICGCVGWVVGCMCLAFVCGGGGLKQGSTVLLGTGGACARDASGYTHTHAVVTAQLNVAFNDKGSVEL